MNEKSIRKIFCTTLCRDTGCNVMLKKLEVRGMKEATDSTQQTGIRKNEK